MKYIEVVLIGDGLGAGERLWIGDGRNHTPGLLLRTEALNHDVVLVGQQQIGRDSIEAQCLWLARDDRPLDCSSTKVLWVDQWNGALARCQTQLLLGTEVNNSSGADVAAKFRQDAGHCSHLPGGRQGVVVQGKANEALRIARVNYLVVTTGHDTDVADGIPAGCDGDVGRSGSELHREDEVLLKNIGVRKDTIASLEDMDAAEAGPLQELGAQILEVRSVGERAWSDSHQAVTRRKGPHGANQEGCVHVGDADGMLAAYKGCALIAIDA